MYEQGKVVYNLERGDKLEDMFYFSQFNTCKNFKLDYNKSGINFMDSSVHSVNIHHIKIVDTMECISLENEHMTGKKLILVGDINIKFKLKYESNQKRSRYSNKKNELELNVPFSTFIQIPKNIDNRDKVNLIYFIQDVTSSILNKSKLFVSVTMIIKYEN